MLALYGLTPGTAYGTPSRGECDLTLMPLNKTKNQRFKELVEIYVDAVECFTTHWSPNDFRIVFQGPGHGSVIPSITHMRWAQSLPLYCLGTPHPHAPPVQQLKKICEPLEGKCVSTM